MPTSAFGRHTTIRTWLSFTHAYYKCFRVKTNLGLNWYLFSAMLSNVDDHRISTLNVYMKGMFRLNAERVSTMLRHLAEDRDLEIIGFHDGRHVHDAFDYIHPSTLREVNIDENHFWAWTDRFLHIIRRYSTRLLETRIGSAQAASIAESHTIPVEIARVFAKVIEDHFNKVWDTLLTTMIELSGISDSLIVGAKKARLASTEAYLVIHVVWLCHLENRSTLEYRDLCEELRDVRYFVKRRVDRALMQLLDIGFIKSKTWKEGDEFVANDSFDFNTKLNFMFETYTDQLAVINQIIWTRFDDLTWYV